MRIEALTVARIDDLAALIDTGSPYTARRTDSDYWLYATLFSGTCPLAIIDDQIAAAVIAFRSQDHPHDLYLQDVVTGPAYRRRGLAQRLITAVADCGRGWECQRMFLTSDPDNLTAHAAWTALGFVNVPGDRSINGVSVITDYKGPGKTRALYEKTL